MKRLSPTLKGKSKAGEGVVVGRKRFAKISAVEGLELSAAAKRRAAEFDQLGLSPEERVRRIIAAHRKG